MSQQSVQDAFTAFLSRFSKLSTEEQTAAANSVSAFLQSQAPVKESTTTSSTTTTTSSSSSGSSVTGQKPSSHVAQQPGGNSSLNLFGGDGKDSKEKDKSAFYAAGNKQNQSSIFDAPPQSGGSTSVRVSSAPGGNSSISLGGSGDTKTTTTTTTTTSTVSGDFHKDLKAAIMDKNPSFQAFFKQCTQSGRSLSAAQLATGLDGLLKEKAKTLGVNEQSILALFRKNFNKDEIGQSDFTKLFAN